jgi:uncharacterized protein
LPSISERGGVVRIHIYVQPRASRTEVVGEHGDTIKIRVAAPPVDGEANAEVIRFLAKTLGVPQSSVEIVAGGASRRKSVDVRGVALATVVAALAV